MTTMLFLRLRFVTGAAAFAGLCAASCAPPPPQRLLDARTAFIAASSGSAREVAPVELDTARTALEGAEDAYRRHPRSTAVLDLAQVAMLNSQNAIAAANARAEQQRAASAARAAAAANAQAQQAREASAALSATREQLAAERARAAAAQQSLAHERTARAEAEARELESLRNVASVRDEMGALVITLSGQVLFPTGESSLLPGAQQKLDQVARLLRSMPDRTIQVRGYTDASGDPNRNYGLSIARAQAVREYLVANGVPPVQIHASGLGSDRPVASNDTAEGRAENRRVEIVLQPAIGGGPSATP